LKGTALNDTDVVRNVEFNVTVLTPPYTAFIASFVDSITPGNSTYANILFNNTGSQDLNLTIEPIAVDLPPFVDVILDSGGYNFTGPVSIGIPPGGSWSVGVWIIVSEYCPLGAKTVSLSVYGDSAQFATISITIQVV
jgi:hypothetical protein